MRQFLVHDTRDNVGVAVVDIEAGQVAGGATLDNAHLLQITACEAIPLGHKIALKDLKAGDTVIKYGEDIGKVVASIRAGEHVHVHNLKTKRW
jgi:(2R)-sulfolactate sulfo-lyase subunit alpha